MRCVQFVFFGALLFCFLFLPGVSVHSAENNFEWVVNDDNTVTITKYKYTVSYDNNNEVILENVVVPEELGGKTVTAIGDDAFFNQGNGFIGSVTLPETITRIGNKAFLLNKLHEVKLPSGLVWLGDNAFGFNQISEIDLPDSLEHIGASAFASNKLTGVVLPNGVTSIDNYAFATNQIESISIPESLSVINEYVFRGNKLTSVTIPKGVTSIKDYAFYDNPSLSEVRILSSETDLNWAPFPDVGSQLTIYGHKHSGAEAFVLENSTNKGYRFVPFENSVSYDGNSSTSGNVPVDNNRYVRWEQATVPGNTGSLIKPGYRFAGWNTAADGSGVDYAIESKITIQEDDIVLFAKWMLEDAKLPGDTEAPTEENFEWVVNDDGTVTITKYKYTVSYDNNNEVILENVVVPEELGGKTVTAIGDDAFNNSPNGFIGSVTLPETITRIGNKAFFLNKLHEVKLPSGLVWLGDHAFSNNEISQINLPGGLEHIGFSAFGFNKLTSVVLPDGVTSVGKFAFATNQIDSISIPESLSVIDEYVFTGNKLTSVTIPKSVTSINVYAFSGNPSLSEVRILSSKTDLNWAPFPDVGSQLTIYGHKHSGTEMFVLYNSINKGYRFVPFENSVIYDGNGSTSGNVPVDNNRYVRWEQATVLGNTGLLIKPGHRFAGWNTAADGSGVDYAIENKITIQEDDIVLFAKWMLEDAKPPTITGALTEENIQSISGLVVTPHSEDSSNVAYYKISNIVGGMLYQTDGVTQIHEGDFITIAEGATGLKFTPKEYANSPAGDTFSFQVQAAFDSSGKGLSRPSTASITVSEVNQAPVAVDDTLPKVTKGVSQVIVEFANLLMNDSAGPPNESFQSLTITDVGNAVGGTVEIINGHIEFDLDSAFVGLAKFSYAIQDNGKTDGADDFKTASAAVSFEVENKAAMPLANPAGGAVASGTKVILTSAAVGAVIYYTIDGTTPTSASTLYTEPIEITGPMTLKAVAVKSGMLDSEVMTEQYTFVPTAPMPLTATAGDGFVTLNWAEVAATSTVTYSVYKVAGSAAPSNPNEWIPVQTDIMATNFTVIGLTNGTSYTFAVKAFVAGNASGFSNAVTATPRAPGGDGGPGGGDGSGSTSGPTTSTNEVISIPAGSSGKAGLDGEIIIDIPDGAAKQELRITIEKLNDTSGLLTGQETFLSGVYEVLKNLSGNFEKPVTLSIKFDRAKAGENRRVAIFYYNEDKKTWMEVGGTADGEWITADVDHFTKFAVLAVAANKDGDGETTKQPSPSFSDIAGHWGESFIARAVAQKLVNGYPDGTFKPNNPVTRAEFTVMLAAALKLDGTGMALPFKDQDKIGTWAKRAIALDVHAGIVSGYEDGSFRPDARTTRTEMASMIAKALKLSLEDDAQTGFADNGDIPKWAKGAVEAIRKLGIVSGRGDNKFVPNGTATRAEAVVMLLRMLEYKDNR